jgi:hypothetical protein
MEIPLIGKIILYADIILFGLISDVIFIWQLNVVRGHSMKNPDGTVDDWHEQKLFYGIALADLIIAVPFSLLGIILIFLNYGLGYYITGMAAFWFLLANIAFTLTSLRFEKPKITIMWFIAFPFGAIVGLIYIIWTMIYYKEILHTFGL